MEKFDRIMDPIMNALTAVAIAGTVYWIFFRCLIAYIKTL